MFWVSFPIDPQQHAKPFVYAKVNAHAYGNKSRRCSWWSRNQRVHLCYDEKLLICVLSVLLLMIVLCSLMFICVFSVFLCLVVFMCYSIVVFLFACVWDCEFVFVCSWHPLWLNWLCLFLFYFVVCFVLCWLSYLLCFLVLSVTRHRLFDCGKFWKSEISDCQNVKIVLYVSVELLKIAML